VCVVIIDDTVVVKPDRAFAGLSHGRFATGGRMVSNLTSRRPLNLIFALVLLALAAAPLAVVGGWLAGRRDLRASSLVHVGGSDDWWREALPWPHGVQEDDDVHWNFGSPEGPPAGQRDDFTFDPVRLRPGARRRFGGR